MSRIRIKTWAELMGVSQSWVRREIRRENDLERARKHPDKWIVLRFPSNTKLYAFPKKMFQGVAA